jgi:hypothetical protein
MFEFQFDPESSTQWEDSMKQMVRLMSALGLSAAIVIGWGQSLLYA